MILNIAYFWVFDYICKMRSCCLLIIAFCYSISLNAKQKIAEAYYVSAYNQISSMLDGQDTISIKRAVYLAEWAYYEGKLDYKTDFCDEIDRITKFINLFYDVNQYKMYKTGKQLAINEYFFRPYSGNYYKPYLYDFENFSMDKELWENQFVSKVLQTHEGQCRSLPWMYKIIANEIGADVAIAHAPGHTYIMYKDEDKFTPEEWVNLELTTHQKQPYFWIKQNFEIRDSAVTVGTYMTPLSDVQTVACQLADLALGYYNKFKRYDDFTFYCASKSLEYFPKYPNAVIIRGKSLERFLLDHLDRNHNIFDDYAEYLLKLIDETKEMLDKTFMTVETEEYRERRRQQAKEAERYTKENLIPK